jgi:carbon monoxide dehydrogenase subunit G
MGAQSFDLVTHWRLAASLDAVWAVLIDTESWPSWWPAVKAVRLIDPGGPDGVGAVREFTWGTALPYSITFRMTATRVEPMTLIEGEARGELDGVGRWTLTAEGGDTVVRYDWRVDVTKPWQRALAPLLRPVFAWNHVVVMGWGEKGIRKRLGIG